jgi:hypothetical protein
MSQADERAKVFDGAEPLIADDRTELERLRRENSALRSAAHRPRRHIRWRSVLAVVLLVLRSATCTTRKTPFTCGRNTSVRIAHD